MVKNLRFFRLGRSRGGGHGNPLHGLGRSPGEVYGNPLQYSCLENPNGQRSLAGYSPWDCKELDTTDNQTYYLKMVNKVKEINIYPTFPIYAYHWFTK